MGKELANALRERMGSNSQKEFARLLDISEAHLSKILTGDVSPGLTKTAKRIVRVYPELAPFFLPRDIGISITIVEAESEPETA